MIGNAFNFVATAGLEHAIVKFIIKFAKTLWGETGQEAVVNWVKTKFVPKGLDDESVFGYILSVAPYKNGDVKTGEKINPDITDKVDLIRNVYATLSQEDIDNNTTYASNARIIIVMDAIGHGFITTEQRDADGNIIEIKKEPDPDYFQPGIAIIQDMATVCDTHAKIRNYLLALGVFQDAPFGTLDELRHWAKSVGWPWLANKLDQVQVQLQQKTEQTTTIVQDYYQELDNQWEQAVAMPWIPNPFIKIIALLRAM